jgi:hypothetical protein
MKRKYRLLEATKKVSTSPFKPCGVTPEPSGKGSHYGTIEQQWPIMSAELDMSKFPEKKVDNLRFVFFPFIHSGRQSQTLLLVHQRKAASDTQMLESDKLLSIKQSRMIVVASKRSSTPQKPTRKSSARCRSFHVYCHFIILNRRQQPKEFL